jgi:hypothetical protein
MNSNETSHTFWASSAIDTSNSDHAFQDMSQHFKDEAQTAVFKDPARTAQ